MERDGEVQRLLMGLSPRGKHKGRVMVGSRSCAWDVCGLGGRLSARGSTLSPAPSTAQALPPHLECLGSSLMSSDSRAITQQPAWALPSMTTRSSLATCYYLRQCLGGYDSSACKPWGISGSSGVAD